MTPPKDSQKYEEWRRKVMLNLITPEFRVGKTDEEIYGLEKAKEIQEKKSKSSKGREAWNKGKEGVYSQETIQKMKEAQRGETHPMYGKHHSEDIKSKLRQSRANQILPVKDTKIEVKIQMFLKELGYEYFTHQYMNINHAYQCDILVPALNMVVECDGDYWHKYPIGNEIDHIRTKELLEKGFKVLRLWEHNIRVMDIGKFKKYI